MPNFLVTSDFAPGSAGNVVFRRKEWLNSASEGLIPPAEVTATLAGSPPAISQSLRATTEDGVDPSFQYEVEINLDGVNQMLGFMELTENSELGDVFNWTTPPYPDIFVTRQEFEELETALGDPASQADLTALEGVVDNVIADLDTEEAARAAADTLLDGRLDTAEADIVALENADVLFDGRLDDLEALGVPTPVGATDGKVVKVLDDAYVLDDDETGGGGGGGGVTLVSKDDASTTPVLAPQTTPTAVHADLEIPVTIPASGEALVHLEAYARLDGGTGLYWSVWDVTGTPAMIKEQLCTTGGTNPGMRVRQSFIVTGTPDEVIDVAWYHKREDAGNAHTWYGGAAGPAMLWWEPLL